MSIKNKLAIVLSVIVTIVLASSITLNYISTRNLLIDDQEKQMRMVADEIKISIESSNFGSKYIEDLIGEKLRLAALIAQGKLNPDAKKVSNEDLVKLSKLIGVTDITLFQRVGNDIIGVKSSDPKEIDLSTKDWGYWFDAFKQLLDHKDVTVTEGQKLPHYWSGPYDVSSSDPSHVDKWGYYYDGSTNYIIDPYLSDTSIQNFENITGPNAIVEKTLKNNDGILEITGFNPNAFGKPPILSSHNGLKLVSLRNRPIVFGDYTYKDNAQDQASVDQATKMNSTVNYTAIINGKKVIKSFIPVKTSQDPYVIGLVTDYKVVQDVLNKQLLDDVLIALVLLVVVFFGSRILAGYIVRPVFSILAKVDEISKGNFGARVNIQRSDELGLLAVRVNSMSENLEQYTRQLHDQKVDSEYQAYHDALTNLPNRRIFNEKLVEFIELAKENSKILAVMFLDLDRFKNINDLFGHTMGDHLLISVGNRLRECLVDNTVFRLGGDEFTVLLYDKTQEEITEIAKKIIDAIGFTYHVDEQELFVTPSVGISVYPYDGEDIETLMKKADTAMYRAKEQGRNNFKFYTADMTDESLSIKMILEKGLRWAIERNELFIYYQPQIDRITNQVIGVEALLRWKHAQLGFISPADFIPIAEETGLITKIGEWVLQTACSQVKAWHDSGLPQFRLAVNLSARQFQQKTLTEVVANVLRETKLPAKCLELEITESIAMQNVEYVIATLQALKNIGIKIAIDDFGTGYSSLNYLKKFPIDTLKIDRSFVKDILVDPDDKQIIAGIISLAHNLHLNVIAEGVETVEQLAFLSDLGCDEFQGFLFNAPLPVPDFEQRYESLREAVSETVYNKN